MLCTILCTAFPGSLMWKCWKFPSDLPFFLYCSFLNYFKSLFEFFLDSLTLSGNSIILTSVLYRLNSISYILLELFFFFLNTQWVLDQIVLPPTSCVTLDKFLFHCILVFYYLNRDNSTCLMGLLLASPLVITVIIILL